MFGALIEESRSHMDQDESKGNCGQIDIKLPGRRSERRRGPSLVPVKRTVTECAENYDPNYQGMAYTFLPKVNDRNEGVMVLIREQNDQASAAATAQPRSVSSPTVISASQILNSIIG
jgi:hypothetical protein